MSDTATAAEPFWPLRTALRTARTAPWAALTPDGEPAAVVAVTLLRGRCAALAAGAAAGVTHRACPPSVVRARGMDVLGAADSAADAYGCAAWNARRLDPTDPTAAAHRPRKDAGHRDPTTRAAAASSPASPPAALWAAVFDDSVEVNIAAASNPACPSALLRIAAAWPRILVDAALASNPALPSEMFEGIVAGMVPAVFWRPRTTWLPHRGPAAASRRWRKPRSNTRPTPAALSAAAAHPNCPPPLLEVLALHDDPKIRQAVAANPVCPTLLLARLRVDSDRGVRYAARAADHSTVPRLTGTQATERWCVLAVATNPNCPPELLGELAESCPDVLQLQAIAAHPACPAELRTMLASDIVPGIAAAAQAADPFSDRRRIARLAASGDPAVRTAAAANLSCPTDLLKQLANDTHPRVRAVAATNLSSTQP